MSSISERIWLIFGSELSSSWSFEGEGATSFDFGAELEEDDDELAAFFLFDIGWS